LEKKNCEIKQKKTHCASQEKGGVEAGKKEGEREEEKENETLQMFWF
jgi:hypothetical protein